MIANEMYTNLPKNTFTQNNKKLKQEFVHYELKALSRVFILQVWS